MKTPDGKVCQLYKGWLRASHLEGRSRAFHCRQQPPPATFAAEPLEPGTRIKFPIEIWPICNVFKPGHRMRLEIANADSIIASQGRPHVTLRTKATNTVH